MKGLIFFFLLVSASAMASTIDSHVFPISRVDSEENFLLSTTQTRTAYRQDTVARTCYRNEFVGYRNVCDYYPETQCYETRDSARICRPVPVYRCEQVPQYRNVAYTCYETISIPYEVVDFHVKANFRVTVDRKPKEPTDPTACLIGFTMEGEKLHSHADCPNELILAIQNKTTEIDRSGTVVHNYNVSLKALDAASVLAPLDGGLSEMQLEGNTLTFKTGDLSKNPNFHLSLFIERRRLLKGDETLINRNLAPSEYTFEKNSEQFGVVKVDLNKLVGGINSKKKHVIRVKMNVNLEAGTIMNRKTPDLSREATITVNN